MADDFFVKKMLVSLFSVNGMGQKGKCTNFPGDTGYELLEKAGRKRGFLMRGAQVDTERMARILLDEFRAGKLGRFTLETAPTEEVTP